MDSESEPKAAMMRRKVVAQFSLLLPLFSVAGCAPVEGYAFEGPIAASVVLSMALWLYARFKGCA